MISARQALDRLRDGNRRFVSERGSNQSSTGRMRRKELAEGQEPFAVILGCSDSREPPEIILDQGLGDLFVIRVAGNVIAPHQIGSVEFAASEFGTQLVVILGHSRCGAVLATLKDLQSPAAGQSPNLRSIIDSVRPAVEPLMETELRHDPDGLVRQAVRANIRASVRQLRAGSQILDQLIKKGRFVIVGAKYSLQTGVVDFFEGVPGEEG